MADDVDGDIDIPMDQEALDNAEIVPNSMPPSVPAEGTYINALNEAGVDPERIAQMQNSK